MQTCNCLKLEIMSYDIKYWVSWPWHRGNSKKCCWPVNNLLASLTLHPNPYASDLAGLSLTLCTLQIYSLYYLQKYPQIRQWNGAKKVRSTILYRGRDVGWNFQVWKFHKFREFFKIFQVPLFEIFIEISYFNYNSPITRKNVSQV